MFGMTLNIDVPQLLWWVFASIALGSAILMVTRRNPIASLLFLVLTFFSLAALYVLMQAHFIAAVQIIVYAGAIMVLFLFVIMLLNLGNDYEPDLRSNLWKVLAGGTSLVMVALLARMLDGGAMPLGDVAGPAVMAAQVAEYGAVGVIGVPMFLDYAVHLQATGLLLLVAVVGAVVLAKRKI